MLALDASISGFRFKAPRYWRLYITRDFSKPEYYIGQTVFHKMKVKRGEILHQVMVIGIFWTGVDWQYAISLPEEHPWFLMDDREIEWADELQLEPM